MLEFDLRMDVESGHRILYVRETLFGFNKTITRHWYFDIDAWRQSSTGEMDSPIDRDCAPGAIRWIRTHYFPKVGLSAECAATQDRAQ